MLSTAPPLLSYFYDIITIIKKVEKFTLLNFSVRKTLEDKQNDKKFI